MSGRTKNGRRVLPKNESIGYEKRVSARKRELSKCFCTSVNTGGPTGAQQFFTRGRVEKRKIYFTGQVSELGVNAANKMTSRRPKIRALCSFTHKTVTTLEFVDVRSVSGLRGAIWRLELTRVRTLTGDLRRWGEEGRFVEQPA